MRKAAPVLLLALLAACTPGKTDNGSEAVATTTQSGASLFGRCAACHIIKEGGRHGLGPNLHGVVGRKAAAGEGYRYSPALAASGLVWDEPTLDRFLENPFKTVPGTKMTFAGLKRPEQRKAMIDYLRSNGKAEP
jgi:cytochrome c